jgi:hypothetical protein
VANVHAIYNNICNFENVKQIWISFYDVVCGVGRPLISENSHSGNIYLLESLKSEVINIIKT